MAEYMKGRKGAACNIAMTMNVSELGRAETLKPNFNVSLARSDLAQFGETHARAKSKKQMSAEVISPCCSLCITNQISTAVLLITSGIDLEATGIEMQTHVCTLHIPPC